MWKKLTGQITKSRAAAAVTAAAAVFLCCFTLLEFLALKLELEVPALELLAGGPDGIWLEEYRREEQALDDSTENEVLKMVDATGEDDIGSVGNGETGLAEESGVTDGVSGVKRAAAGSKNASLTEGTESTGGTSGVKKDDAVGGNASLTEGSGSTGGTSGVKKGMAGNEGTGLPDRSGDETAADVRANDAKKAADGEKKDTAQDMEEGEVSGNHVSGKKNGTADGGEAFPYYIKVNRKQNCITVFRMDADGAYTEPYRAMVCSTGLYNATPRGTYHLSTKYLWRELYGGVYGQYATRITGGVLFHSVPYYRKSKSTLCTDKYNKLGQQASMGCIRLTVEDAKWIAENCPQGTTVEIYDGENPGPLGKPEAEKIDLDSPNKSWDPTDPDENNPWLAMSDDA